MRQLTGPPPVNGNDAARLRDLLGAFAATTTLAGSTITETFNGVTVTTTIAAGVVTEVFGSPISETWRTTISAGTISTVRTA